MGRHRPVAGGVPSPGPPEEAWLELARRWLAAFGPATVDDVQWWTGWEQGQTKAVLAALGDEVVEVELDDGTPALLATADAEPVEPPGPWVALLPALDPTAMGWKGRDFYLCPHRDRLFDRNGNVGPTAWNDGRIVGAGRSAATGGHRPAPRGRRRRRRRGPHRRGRGRAGTGSATWW